MAFWTRGAEAFDTNIDLADLSVSIRTKEQKVEGELERRFGLRFDDPEAEVKFRLKIRELEELKRLIRRDKNLSSTEKKEKQKEVAVEMIATFRVAAKYKEHKMAHLALTLSPTGWEFTCDPEDDLVPVIFKEIAESARKNRDQLSERSPEFKLAEEILERSSRIPVAKQISQLANGGIDTILCAREVVIAISPDHKAAKRARKLLIELVTYPDKFGKGLIDKIKGVLFGE